MKDAKLMLDTIARRRTVHRFEDREVDQGILEQVLETAMFAPTRFGQRPWHFLVVREPALKARLIELLEPRRGLAGNPVLVAVALDADVPSLVVQVDAAAATQTLLLAATAVGLGSAWIGSPDDADWKLAVGELLAAVKAPPGIKVASVVALGWPAEELPAHDPDETYEQARVNFDVWHRTEGVATD